MLPRRGAPSLSGVLGWELASELGLASELALALGLASELGLASRRAHPSLPPYARFLCNHGRQVRDLD